MLRRSISILLITVHLAIQLALGPHVHGDVGHNQSSDHNARPHVHLCRFGWVTHAHGHSHTHSYVHDHGAREGHDHVALSTCRFTVGEGHDDDAVYLPTEVSAPNLKRDHGSAQVAMDLATLPLAAELCDPAEPPERLTRWVLPDDLTPSCPRYLMLRALRI